ncbi:MAG: hypothetical protein INH41_07000 [Myxococcaceae bacterium]|jgi:uncharacterized delta-60 repeat protein|nr:hypothetical protein [Myxococcaceae bacterium]
MRSLLAAFSLLTLTACPGPTPSPDGGAGADAGMTVLYRSILPPGVSGLGYAVAKQGDKLVAAGAASLDDGGTRGADLFLARFDTSRQLDPTFGRDGLVFTDTDGGMPTIVGRFDSDSISDLVVDGTGIIVAGYGRSLVIPGSGSVVVARYTANGQLDTSFGNAGGLRIDTFRSGMDLIDATYARILKQPDGKLLVGGTVQSNFFVARFNADGSPDTSFSKVAGVGFGNAFGSRTENEAVRSMVLQPSGKVVVGGGDSSLVMGRLNADGSDDMTFGTAGFVRVSGGRAEAMLGRPDGRLIILGASFEETGATRVYRVRMLQTNADGVPDTSFGPNGRVDVTMPQPISTVRGAALQPDGSIVLYLTGVGDTYLARITPAGALDTAFGLRPTPIVLPLFQPADLAATHLLVDGSTAWICDLNNQKFAEPDQRKNFFDVVRVDL